MSWYDTIQEFNVDCQLFSQWIQDQRNRSSYKHQQFLHPRFITGCLFHFCQAVWRRMQELGFAGRCWRYTVSQITTFESHLVLTFLPDNDIPGTARKLRQSNVPGGRVLYLLRGWTAASSCLCGISITCHHPAGQTTRWNHYRGVHSLTELLRLSSKFVLTHRIPTARGAPHFNCDSLVRHTYRKNTRFYKLLERTQCRLQ